MIAVAVATALTQHAYAQQSEPAAGKSTGSLEEVIVTAQRRAERIQDVPIAITALSADQLTRNSIFDLTGIQKLTPGLSFGIQGAYFQPTIRGVGTAVVTAGAGSNVGTYVDGFYQANPQGGDFQLLNIENVQVLKGPQGTLFGHNTTGGAILVTTKAPSYDTGGTLGMSYGNYNAQRYQGYFTTGLGSHVAFDVAGTLTKGDGYVHDIVDGDGTGAYKNWTTRLGLKVDFTDNFSALFHYQHGDVDDPSIYLQSAYKLNGVPQVAGAAYNSFGAPFPPAVYTTAHNQVTALDSTTYRVKSDNFQLTLKWDLGFATLKSLTQYQKLDAYLHAYNFSFNVINLGPPVGLVAPLQINIPNHNGHTKTQEFILTSNSDGRLQWTAGAFYLDWEQPFGADLSQAGGPFVSTGRSSTETFSWAGYFDATYQLLDNLYLTAGTRYSYDQVKNAYFHDFTGPVVNGVQTYISEDLPTLKGDRWTPRFVLRYTPTENSSIYASYSKGYKSKIYNVGGAQTVPVKPEDMDAYEVGYKVAAQNLSFDIAAYFYDYNDLQVAAYSTILGTNTPISVVYNAQKAQLYGLDGHLQYDFTPNFSVNVGAAYIHAQYQKFAGSPTFTQCLDLLACGASYGFFEAGAVDLHNAHMIHAPKFTGNIGARYSLDLFGGTLAFSGNLHYTSKFYFDSSAVYSTNGYKLLDLRTEWTDASGTYTLALWGKNVLNESYKTIIQASAAGVGAGWGTPATYGVEGKVHF